MGEIESGVKFFNNVTHRNIKCPDYVLAEFLWAPLKDTMGRKKGRISLENIEELVQNSQKFKSLVGLSPLDKRNIVMNFMESISTIGVSKGKRHVAFMEPIDFSAFFWFRPGSRAFGTGQFLFEALVAMSDDYPKAGEALQVIWKRFTGSHTQEIEVDLLRYITKEALDIDPFEFYRSKCLSEPLNLDEFKFDRNLFLDCQALRVVVEDISNLTQNMSSASNRDFFRVLKILMSTGLSSFFLRVVHGSLILAKSNFGGSTCFQSKTCDPVKCLYKIPVSMLFQQRGFYRHVREVQKNILNLTRKFREIQDPKNEKLLDMTYGPNRAVSLFYTSLAKASGMGYMTRFKHAKFTFTEPFLEALIYSMSNSMSFSKFTEYCGERYGFRLDAHDEYADEEGRQEDIARLKLMLHNMGFYREYSDAEDSSLVGVLSI